MTQKEFNERTGLTPTIEEFNNIHKVYMACPTLDKDEFCREYKKHGMSRIIDQLMDALDASKGAYDIVFNDYIEVKDKKCREDLETAKYLLAKSVQYRDEDMENRALQFVSKGTAILIKVQYGYPMSEADIDYIAKNLK